MHGSKKAQLDNLYTLVQALITSFAALLLLCLAPIFCFISPASLLFCSRSLIYLSPLSSCLETLTALLSHFVLVLVLRL